MRKSWVVLPVLLALAGCGDAGGGTACTLIGAVAGVTLDVDLPGAGSGTLRLCGAGGCADHPVELRDERVVVTTSCSGTRPDDTCGAVSGPGPGKVGFVVVPELTEEPVTATLVLRDAAGVELLRHTGELRPLATRPNGPGCTPEAAQAGVSVAADGAVTTR
ncbi:hypothetical protein [Actinosynnema mirum]|uniref:Lipoprotein n=1 Tax=Actinosynnema mirum (strain ATCC 29888 / DSM 43827 / JCM 3225 / NBRC 14064 / NCIMB 13271 / NRRL B-12336 / IMRU 3971 / 101) TaxID=446462 RepID=C6WBD8_ACTMD|nr:hypothetical protein [Actinosynnema mirum]ACU35506.1 hypothetical protein Amir_1557 [Actinosynnema mirum DSM 43827]